MPDSQSAQGRAIQPINALFYDLQTNPTRYDERAFVSGLLSHDHDFWCDYASRLLRYSVGWALYEGTIYRDIHRWGLGLKEKHDIYEAVQCLRSPAKRIVDLIASYVYRGPLDMDAGDGVALPSSVPIVLDDETLRPLIAMIFRLSVWQTNKDCYPRDCASKGDVFLQVVDDEVRRRAYFVIRDPATVYDVTKDDQGNIKGYIITEPRHDPEGSLNEFGILTKTATYIEVCTRDEDTGLVRFRTFKDRVPVRNDDGTYETFDWGDGRGSEWTVNYGFVPLVHVQFKDVGKGWGWCVYQGSFDKLIGVDDIASKGNDQVRKLVDPPVVFSGAEPKQVKRIHEFEGYEDSFDRESTRSWYIPKEATATPLVSDLDLADLVAYLESFSAEIKEDFPILMVDSVSADASGKSRQLARGRVEGDVYDIRANLDAGQVKVLQMTLSVMAIKGYAGPDDNVVTIPVDAYKRGLLNIKIGNRPVFSTSEDDKLDQAKKRADIFAALASKGMPFEYAAIEAGYPTEVVAAMVKAKDAADAEQQRIEQQAQADAMAATTTTSVGGAA